MTLTESIREMLLTAGVNNVCIAEEDTLGEYNELVILRGGKSSIFDAKADKQCIRVIAAAQTPVNSETLAWQAFYALNGNKPQNTDRPVIGRITPLQTPYYWEKDEAGRFQTVFRINIVSQI